MVGQRWTLAGIVVTALAAMVNLIVFPESGAVATVLVWALAFVVIAIVFNLAWTFPVFRGLVYRATDRVKAWRERRQDGRWLPVVYLDIHGGLKELTWSAPRDSAVEDQVVVELVGSGASHVATVSDPAVELGTKRVTFSAQWPEDFPNAPTILPVGRYRVRWSDSAGHHGKARIKVDKTGRIRRAFWIRHREWKRSLRELAARREKGYR